MPERQGGIGVVDKQDTSIGRPRMWRVVFANDDFTPMDFVVMVLMLVFHHPAAQANSIMLDVHTKGKGVAGTYTREVAETKAAQTLDLADKHAHPLGVMIEPE